MHANLEGTSQGDSYVAVFLASQALSLEDYGAAYLVYVASKMADNIIGKDCGARDPVGWQRASPAVFTVALERWIGSIPSSGNCTDVRRGATSLARALRVPRRA